MFDIFKKAAYDILQKHASLKQRYARANQALFINKKINKNYETNSFKE